MANVETSLAEMRESYDWREAMSVAVERPSEGYFGSVECFGLEDVAEVIASSEGENDGASWVAVFRLKDGRFAFLAAWCDYTGWGCQDGGDIYFADSLEHLIRWALGEGDRDRLDLSMIA